MRLYYHPASLCSRSVLMTARHLDLRLDLAVIDLFKGEQNTSEFLKLNPNHRIPVLEDDRYVLWESYAIMQYLADRTPGQTLYPSDPRARADVNRWLFWCAQDFMPGIVVLNWENLIKARANVGPADQAEVARGEASLIKAATVLDAHLKGRDWICNGGLSLADLALAAPLANQHDAAFPVVDLPDLQRWFKRIQALECWQNS